MGEMLEPSDAQLLRDYAERRDEAAFREIVSRYADLVYSAALRQVDSTDLAGDVAQAVFTDLARKAGLLAGQLAEGSSLLGWLYRSTRFASLNQLRRDRRRLTNEREAMEHLLNNSEAAPDWERIRPVLDEAMASLNEDDRDALLLRFFKQQDLRAVGKVLGISDDAAQKRVSRAVERLREFFVKRGVTIGASGLAVALTANAVQAAPVRLVATISTAAVLAGATLAATTTATTMNWLNIKSITAIVVAAIAAGTGTHLVQQRETTRLRNENQSLIAEREKLANERATAMSAVAANKEEIERWKKNQTELLRLRGEVSQLRRQLESQNAQTRSQGDTAKPVIHPPGSYISTDQLALVGYATPETALESITWSMMHGTYDQVNEGVSPTLLAGASEDKQAREQFEASQKKAAPLFKGIQIVAKKVLADDTVELKMRWDSHPIPGEQRDLPSFMIQPMVKVGDRWKLGGNTRGHQDAWDEDAQIQTFAP